MAGKYQGCKFGCNFRPSKFRQKHSTSVRSFALLLLSSTMAAGEYQGRNFGTQFRRGATWVLCLPETHTYWGNISLVYISLKRSYLCVSHRACISEVYISWGGTISWHVHLVGRCMCISWARLFRGHTSQRPASP
jgi:hypothetical protein